MSEVFRDGRYAFEGREETSGDLPEFWAGIVERYPIVSIEDGAAEDDWDGWKALTDRLGDRVQLVGDDLFVTNVERLGRGIEEGVGERDPRQGEPDRDADRDARRDRARARERLRRRHVAPLRRDRGHDDRRPRGGDERRPDQDRRAVAQRPRREVQPAPADRGGARRRTRSIPAGPRLPARASLRHMSAELPRRTKIVATLGPASSSGDAVLDARARRDGRRAAELLPRDARGPRGADAGRARDLEGARAADRDHRRPAGAEGADRRSPRAGHARPRRAR